MPTLLHIDSSLNINGPSVSRTHTAAFVKEWLQQNPEGKVIRRDLAAEPLPHLDEADYYAETTPALRETLASEMEEADIILIGAPMHNFSIPSTLKAWIDQACIMGRTTGPDSTTAGTTTIVITSRGGGYYQAPQTRTRNLSPRIWTRYSTACSGWNQSSSSLTSPWPTPFRQWLTSRTSQLPTVRLRRTQSSLAPASWLQ